MIKQTLRDDLGELVWTPDQTERREAAERGECVVANVRARGGRRVDGALLRWASAEGRLVRIDRRTEWGNPFEMSVDGDRAEVVDKFTRFYLPHKRGLLAKIPTLRGKVLACWCHPDRCHGHTIADAVNGKEP